MNTQIIIDVRYSTHRFVLRLRSYDLARHAIQINEISISKDIEELPSHSKEPSEEEKEDNNGKDKKPQTNNIHKEESEKLRTKIVAIKQLLKDILQGGKAE